MNRIENRRILLIDDTPAIHEDFRKILVPTGSESELDEMEASLFGTPARAACTSFELDSAYQGKEGLALVRAAQEAAAPYAMAFVDMRMPPGWDGIETIEHLWLADPELQVVICTAYADYSWEEVLDRLNVADRLLILKKPFDAIEVRQLASALTAKWQLTRLAALKMASLEEAVRTRTAELKKANEALQQDIVERKRAELQTRDAYQRIADILEFLPDATFVVDRENSVIAWNRAIEVMTGVRKEEILGQGDYAYALPFYGVRRKILIDMIDEDQEVRESIYSRFAKNGRTLSAEALVLLPDGERYLWCAASPFYDPQGNRVGGIQTLRDVTEARQVEQERSRLEAQLHHSSVIKSLTIRLGHDLKTPLTPLFALLPMVRKKVGDPSLERMLDICQDCAVQIQGVTTKSLELVRLSSRVVPLELASVRLAGTAEYCAYKCAGLFTRRGITFLNAIDPMLRVQGEEGQLALLLDNLFSNAARYAAENGVVRISAHLKDREVVVSVEDDGIGLEPGHKKPIFEEFFKADAARQDVSTQGLGLAICKSIALNHQGRIWAESPGKDLGATIFFTLQLSDPA
jgi:PAS domain S-box-containing protein